MRQAPAASCARPLAAAQAAAGPRPSGHARRQYAEAVEADQHDQAGRAIAGAVDGAECRIEFAVAVDEYGGEGEGQRQRHDGGEAAPEGCLNAENPAMPKLKPMKTSTVMPQKRYMPNGWGILPDGLPGVREQAPYAKADAVHDQEYGHGECQYAARIRQARALVCLELRYWG